MKVKELIQLLQQQDPDMIVVTADTRLRYFHIEPPHVVTLNVNPDNGDMYPCDTDLHGSHLATIIVQAVSLG